ncbi:unnamed protein product, partial [Mesorhabditis belari]|uniref:Matrix-remodeling-associated protein 7 helical domain-containing protein n=1 Tax=Mesorhabditis belari TaxID=2138241 RepID=A0AAF3J525_9BILA
MTVRIPFGEYWDVVKRYVITFDLSTLNGRFTGGVTQYTHENPLTVIGFTLLAGVLMGAFAFLAAQISVRRNRPKKLTQKVPTIDEEEEEELNEQDFNIPLPLRGGFDTKMLASLRKTRGLIRQDGDTLIETKFHCSLEGETEELLKEEKKEKKKKDKSKKNKNNEKKENNENGEKNEKPEKKVAFDKTVINNDEKDFGDLSALANENILGTLGELHGKLKTAEIRAKSRLIEREMSQEQLDEEARIRAQQMEAIFKLMKADEQKFGIHDKDEMEEQFRMYSL